MRRISVGRRDTAALAPRMDIGDVRATRPSARTCSGRLRRSHWVIGGVERKIHFFAMDLPHSDAIFVAAYPAETTEAFCDGHVRAFAFFDGVAQSILYDNTKLAVARILGDGKRQRTRAPANFNRIICSRIGLAVLGLPSVVEALGGRCQRPRHVLEHCCEEAYSSRSISRPLPRSRRLHDTLWSP